MFSLLLTAVLIASPPSPTGTADRVVRIDYAPQSVMVGLAVSLAGSASTQVELASWKLTDGTLAGALCMAATRGVAVKVALDLTGGSNTEQHQIARQITLSGGTVWACTFPHHVANNFITADGTYSIQGTYYYSPTAVQIGAYSMSISGTHAASVNQGTFASLISGGTITMASHFSPPLQPSTVVELTRTRLVPPLIEDYGASREHRAIRAYRAALRQSAALRRRACRQRCRLRSVTSFSGSQNSPSQ